MATMPIKKEATKLCGEKPAPELTFPNDFNENFEYEV